MKSFIEQFWDNYNAIVTKTLGAASHNQIMWAATLLTVFERLETWVINKPTTGRVLNDD